MKRTKFPHYGYLDKYCKDRGFEINPYTDCHEVFKVSKKEKSIIIHYSIESDDEIIEKLKELARP